MQSKTGSAKKNYGVGNKGESGGQCRRQVLGATGSLLPVQRLRVFGDLLTHHWQQAASGALEKIQVKSPLLRWSSVRLVNSLLQPCFLAR
jgi:hypothetical protein